MTARLRGPALVIGMLVAAGCQQKMAEQPYYRPYEQGDRNLNGPQGQTLRSLEPGTMHRHQPAADDPIASWLTPAGRKMAAEATAASGDTAAAGDKNSPPPVAAPSKDPRGGRAEDKIFVDEFPFEIAESDLKRGQTLYNAACALCHGAAGYGNGKIPERGFLRPPSYHVDPAGKAFDWSTLAPDPTFNKAPAGPGANGAGPDPNQGKLVEADGKGGGLPAGHSRGYYRWGIKIPLKEVPVGYIYQVISWGYGGMAAHDTQLPDPTDRWRVVAYVRALQYSQAAPVADLPQAGKAELDKQPKPEGK